MKRMSWAARTLCVLCALAMAAGAAGCAGKTGPDGFAAGIAPYIKDGGINVSMETSETSVSLTAGGQKIAFVKNADGEYILTTYVMKNGQWTAFFDKGEPLIQGKSFGAHPTRFEVVADTDAKKAVKLSGTHPGEGYDFDITVEVFAGNPLIHFVVVNHLKKELVLDDYEPLVMLWRNGTFADRVSINQEVPTYQTVDDTVHWKSGFPSSYCYTGGMESAVYFDMTPMTWYSMKNGVRRFKVSQVRTVERAGATGVGLDLRAQTSGKKIAAGDMVVDLYLYGGARDAAPSKLEALDTSVNAFSYSLASTVDWPVNYMDDILSYEFYVSKIIEGLMAENVSFQWKTPRKGSPWTDAPLFPERQVEKLIQRPGYIPGTGLSGGSGKKDFWGDWNCNNNTILPWLLFERLHPDNAQRALLTKASEGILTYFDRTSSVYRSFDTHPGYEGTGLEFIFQNLFMQQGALWVSDFTDPTSFDPALGGKFLQAMKGLMTLAHNVDYKMPQLYEATRMIPATSIDEKHLGVTYEVYGSAIYAYNMCLAYSVTGSDVYLNEAKTALQKLFGGMEFYVNSLKEKLYTDPYEFPINEVSTAPWGIAAAQWLYRLTGDTQYLTYSANLRNIALRMMNWFESALADDPIDQSLGTISFFHAFPTTETTCPWESIMTYLPMLMELKNSDIAPSQVLLKIFNLFRINGFSFSGASWNPDVVKSAKNYQSAITAYFMPEDYYCAETPTMPGQNGANSYMSNALMYSYILYEAYANADDREVMVLNLDITDEGLEMANGIRRNFIVLNSTGAEKSFKVKFSDLDEKASYSLKLTDQTGKETVKIVTGKALMNDGVHISLGSMAYTRATVELADKEKTERFEALKTAQRKLMMAYSALQTKAEDGVDDVLLGYKAVYQEALSLYADAKYAECAAKIDSFYGNIAQ